MNIAQMMIRMSPSTDQLDMIAEYQELSNGRWGYKFEDGSEGYYDMYHKGIFPKFVEVKK